jgi:hypothetical protein
VDLSVIDVDAAGVITVPGSAIGGWRSTADASLSDWWFAALDQLRVKVGNELCTTQVVGVHVHAFNAWVQLQFAEQPWRSLLLHLQPGAGVVDAIRAIQAMTRVESA